MGNTPKTYDIVLTWIPNIRVPSKNQTYTLQNVSKHNVEHGLWGLLMLKLIQEGRSNNVMFALDDILIKYDNGTPVYDRVYLGIPDNNVIRHYNLLEKSTIKILAYETN